jgi:hypothetical protein
LKQIEEKKKREMVKGIGMSEEEQKLNKGLI